MHNNFLICRIVELKFLGWFVLPLQDTEYNVQMKEGNPSQNFSLTLSLL